MLSGAGSLPVFRGASILAVLVLLLPGCMGGGHKGSGSPDSALPELQATSTTGVIRAVVVDEAIRPLAGANVSVQVPDHDPIVRSTDAAGFAGFEGLDPGNYLVEVKRPGYISAQQSVEVVAGKDDPAPAKFLLTRIVGDPPFYVEREVEAFMQCAVGFLHGSANLCFIANYYPCFALHTAGQQCPGNLTTDTSGVPLGYFLDYQRAPDWTQVEMVWKSTQPVSGELSLRVDIETPDGSIVYANSTAGPSPIYATFNRTEADDNDLGTKNEVFLESFTETDTVGVTVQQELRYFVHAFYGYTPPDGWRFTNDGTVPQPPY